MTRSELLTKLSKVTATLVELENQVQDIQIEINEITRQLRQYRQVK